jgi:hypothetical protein
MKPANDNLLDKTIALWAPRLGRHLSREDARQISAAVSGFFNILTDWSRAEMPAPANDIGEPAASASGEARHER